VRRWIAIIAVVLAAAACSTTERIETVTLPAVDPGKRVVDDQSAFVGIEAWGCGLQSSIGSGLGFPEDGLVVTTAHTVAGATEINVVDADGAVRPAAVHYFDPTKDLAVLAADGLIGQQLTVSKAALDGPAQIVAWRRPAPVGDRAFIAVSGTVTRRLLVTIEDIYVQGSYERNAIEVDATISSGDSGAPVLDESGAVVGLVYAASRSRSVAFALDHTEIQAALDGAATRSGAVSNGRCV